MNDVTSDVWVEFGIQERADGRRWVDGSVRDVGRNALLVGLWSIVLLLLILLLVLLLLLLLWCVSLGRVSCELCAVR